MDAEERALLRAICEHPDEDVPRLVYADWLQEHDQPKRAELIRAQIGLARSKGDDDARRPEWSARVRYLLQTYSKLWRGQLPRIPRVSWGPFERGLVESAVIRMRDWTPAFSASLMGLFECAPLRVLRLSLYSWSGHTPEECAELLRWGGVERVDELHLSCNQRGRLHDTRPAAPFLARLWTHPWGPRPRVIDLREADVPDNAVTPLLGLPDDARLPELVFPGTLLGDTPLGVTIRTALTARFGSRIRFV
jgi:uncharacterized protein (TIGR02996 family)